MTVSRVFSFEGDGQAPVKATATGAPHPAIVSAVKEDIRQTLRVGWIDPALDAVAAQPLFFTAAWSAMRPNFGKSFLMLARAVRTQAEDAVHDAAEKAWRAWRKLGDLDRFEAWFGRILVNVCRDRLRRRRRITAIEAAALGDDQDPPGSDDPTTRTDAVEGLRRLLGALSADERIVVALRYEADMTVPAIARLIGTPEGTVKSRLHHALARLRQLEEGSES